MSLKFYIIDTETTGLRVKYHEITEVSIIRCSDRVQLTEMVRCENPERASIDALTITGKTIDDLYSGNSKEYVVSKIDKFLNEDGLTPAHRCFVAHNASFDMKFLHALYEEVNKICPINLWLDTISLTRQFAKENGIIKPKVNLEAACNLLQIKKVAGKHNSKSDSRNTYLLHKELIENRKVDYLPFIKTATHSIAEEEKEVLEDINNIDF